MNHFDLTVLCFLASQNGDGIVDRLCRQDYAESTLKGAVSRSKYDFAGEYNAFATEDVPNDAVA